MISLENVVPAMLKVYKRLGKYKSLYEMEYGVFVTTADIAAS